MLFYLYLEDKRYRIRLRDGQAQSCATAGKKNGPWRNLKPSSGGECVLLHTKVRRRVYKNIPISHAVLKAVGKRRPLPPNNCALHFNDNPEDNRPSNLRWGTNKHNTADSIRNKTYGCGRHENHGHAKLTFKKAEKIRRLYKTGKYTLRGLEKIFGISNSNVHAIIHYKIWNPEKVK